MKLYGWFKDTHDAVKDTFDYKLASLELDVTERIIKKMQDRNMSRSDLARELNISKAAVSKFLNNGSNLTLKTLLKVSDVLGCDLNIRLRDSVDKIVLDDDSKVVYLVNPDKRYHYSFGNTADEYNTHTEMMVNYA